MSYSFCIDNMTKSFGDFVLGPIDLTLEKGVSLGLIGANGAGKTTLLNCLSGLIIPNSGDISILDRKLNLFDKTWKRQIGYITDEPIFYENWTGAKNLRFLSKYFPEWSKEFEDELIKRFNCPVNKKTRDLSKGERVMLAIISVLARKPKLLLLDEPTAGLDPVNRSRLLELLWDLLKEGEQSIFYSTHIISDVGNIAEELVFINEGKLTLRTPKDSLTNKWRKMTFIHQDPALNLSSIVESRIEGLKRLIVSSDYNVTLSELREAKAEEIETTRIGLDEIVVHILKEE
ncbi:MAG: ABC transporter ATP-binding protein [Candidatus Hatepunaea meridiana]|nr:ABC transporter ATP-binding protein [Candidatus Hatepunaea meridiana]